MSAGADLSTFAGGPAEREDRDQGRRMAKAIEEMRAVTIAKMHGWCVGGGLVLAAVCDLRIAAESARFSIPEVDIGIPLAWGAIPRLVREIGRRSRRSS
jgi:enoyl-CoA hydratase/carnithine racemase